MQDGNGVADVSPLRVGVVGCGYWGAKHLRVLRGLAGLCVVAIDSDRRTLELLHRSLPALDTRSAVDDAWDDIDAIVVATSPRTHADIAIAALRAGKHVLVEKPLATSFSEACEMSRVAASNSRVLMVGHTFEYHGAVRYLRDAIDEGRLGDIHYIDTARLNPGLCPPDVNVMWDLAVHDISIANFLLGRGPVAVSAWGSRHAHHDFEEVAHLMLQYIDPNVDVHIHVSWLDPAKVRRVTVVGSRTMAVYNDLNPHEPLRFHDKGIDLRSAAAPVDVPPLTYRYGDIISPFISFPEPLVVEDSHFVACIREGIEPLTGGANGAAVVAILEAADRAMRTGQPESVEMPLSEALVV